MGNKLHSSTSGSNKEIPTLKFWCSLSAIIPGPSFTPTTLKTLPFSGIPPCSSCPSSQCKDEPPLHNQSSHCISWTLADWGHAQTASKLCVQYFVRHKPSRTVNHWVYTAAFPSVGALIWISLLSHHFSQNVYESNFIWYLCFLVKCSWN